MSRNYFTRKNFVIGAFSALILGFAADRTGLAIEGKDVLTAGYTSSDVVLPTDTPFDEDALEAIVSGVDIIPGLPEQGAMCAKTMRAIANTIFGESYFKHHRLFSKAEYKLFGKKELAADAAGINGSAWKMYFNILEAGGELLYKTDNPMADVDISTEFVMDHAQIGDIIGFYYPDSQYNAVAQEAGFTHMGIVVGETDNSDPIIAHLFHSDQYFPAEEESGIEHMRKEFLSKLYGVEHNTIPAFRVETMSHIRDCLTFQGYVGDAPNMEGRTEPEYRTHDPLIYVRAVLRPNYAAVSATP